MGTITSITDFGASTSSPDNTTAIQNAFNSSAEIYVPAGRWNCRPLTWPASLTKVWGSGTLVGVGAPPPGVGFLTVQDHGFLVSAFLEGLGLDITAPGYSLVTGLAWVVTEMQVFGLTVRGGYTSILGNGSPDGQMAAALVEDCDLALFSFCAINMQNPNVAWVRRNVITGNPSGALHSTIIQGGADVTFRENSIYGGTPGTFGTYVSGLNRGSIQGNYRQTPNEAIALDSCVDVFVDGALLEWSGNASNDFGISVGASAGQNRNCGVRNTTIRSPGKSGIFIGNQAGAGSGVLNFSIEGGSIVDANMTNDPTWHDAVTIGGMGGEAGIVGTRVHGLAAINEQTSNIKYGVREQAGPAGQKPSNTLVRALHAVGMTMGSSLFVGSGSNEAYPG